MAHKTEKNRCTVVSRYASSAHDAFDDGRLTDAADVDGRLESLVDGCRMEQHGDFGLQILLAVENIIIFKVKYNRLYFKVVS